MKINLKTVLLLVGMSLIMSVPCAFAHTDVTAQQARELIDSTDDLIVVDVREPYEYSDARGHIPGALNYPWNSGVLQARYEELPMDGPVLVVCSSGNRSHQAATFLDSKGFSMVYDMLGGMSAWIWETETGVDADIKYGGGTGEPNNPYLIYTAEQVNAIGAAPNDWDKHFKLISDIDLSGYLYDAALIAPDTDPCDPAFQGTPFKGNFDGNGYTISHLTIQGGGYLGLFGRLDAGAVVESVRLVDANIAGSDYVGALAGFSYGRIATSYTTGTVSGNNRVGGFTGRNWGSITLSHNAAAVTGNNDVGGITAANYGNITTSYNTGALSANMDVGGIAGENYGSIVMTYSTGAVSRSNRAGGLVGYNWQDATITASFWDMEASRLASSDGGIGKTTAEMQTAKTFLDAGWDFVDETKNGVEDIWRIFEGRDYPRLSWERVLDDDFEDGEAGSLWFEYEPDMSKIWVEETGGRLEVYASARADDIDAAYVSNGWRLDVTKNFELKVDFHYGKLDVGDSWVMVGLLPSLAEPVSRIITFEAGCMNEQPFYLYEAINDSWRKEEISDRSSDDGTLYVSYDAGKDELYLSHTGYGKANAWRTVTGLLKNKWAAQPVYVAIGGGSDRVVLDAGDAYLDNFVVDSGVLDLSATPDDAGTEEP
jgi:rhodanese-related sulfurtransferase